MFKRLYNKFIDWRCDIELNKVCNKFAIPQRRRKLMLTKYSHSNSHFSIAVQDVRDKYKAKELL